MEAHVRTSQQYPLQIDTVAVPECRGRLGMTLCPGKKQRGALTGDWSRDLDLDLLAIRDWGATVIVNLMEDHEMAEFGVTDTPSRIPSGIEYLCMPIPDFGVPGPGWEAQWDGRGPGLHARLAAGEAILLHCKGGLGRTGMVAARLLVESGLSPDEAITAVRAARPGTIETAEQEAYVRKLHHG